MSGILSSLWVHLFIKKTNQKGQTATLKPGHVESHSSSQKTSSNSESMLA